MDRGFQEPRANAHDKFPPDYLFELDAAESRSLRTKISTLKPEGANRGAHSKYNYKAFTEKGLYMLATVLKSRRATETRKIRKNPSACTTRKPATRIPRDFRGGCAPRHAPEPRRSDARRFAARHLVPSAIGARPFVLRSFCPDVDRPPCGESRPLPQPPPTERQARKGLGKTA